MQKRWKVLVGLGALFMLLCLLPPTCHVLMDAQVPGPFSVPVAAVRVEFEIVNTCSVPLLISAQHVNDVEFKTFDAYEEYSRRKRGWARREERILAPGETWLAGLNSENETQAGVVLVVACTAFSEIESQRQAMYLVPWKAAHYQGRDEQGGPKYLRLEIADGDLEPIAVEGVRKVALSQ